MTRARKERERMCARAEFRSGVLKYNHISRTPVLENTGAISNLTFTFPMARNSPQYFPFYGIPE